MLEEADGSWMRAGGGGTHVGVGGLGQVVFEVEGVVLPQLSSRSCLRIYLCPYPDLYHEVRMDCE